MFAPLSSLSDDDDDDNGHSEQRVKRFKRKIKVQKVHISKAKRDNERISNALDIVLERCQTDTSTRAIEKFELAMEKQQEKIDHLKKKLDGANGKIVGIVEQLQRQGQDIIQLENERNAAVEDNARSPVNELKKTRAQL